MKKTALLVLTLCCSLWLAGGAVMAHELERDGTLSGVLHIEPDDAVVSGVQSPFEIEFEDTSNAFKLSNCDCLLAAKLDGKTVATKAISASDDLTGKGSIVFPKAGDYDVVVTGKAKTADAFPAFSMTFPEEVSTPGNAVPVKTYTIGAVVVVAVVGVAGGLIVYRTSKLKTEQKKKN